MSQGCHRRHLRCTGRKSTSISFHPLFYQVLKAAMDDVVQFFMQTFLCNQPAYYVHMVAFLSLFLAEWSENVTCSFFYWNACRRSWSFLYDGSRGRVFGRRQPQVVRPPVLPLGRRDAQTSRASEGNHRPDSARTP